MLGIALAALVMSTTASAQYPTKPIRLFVPAAAGDGTDIVARLLAHQLTESLGQTLVVENRPGAGGSIAAAVVAAAAPDGHTLMLANGSSHGVTPGLYPHLPYDTLTDFAAITLIAVSPNLLVVNPNTPAVDIASFLAWVRANPGKVDVASAGNGSLSHLSVEMLRSLGHLSIVNVGYKSAALALNDLAAGQVAAMIINIPSTLALVKAGKLRAIATTSATRTSLMPDLPTLAEAGLTGAETLAWFGLVAPARTPVAILRRLQSETARALARPELREQLHSMGAEPVGNSPEAFANFMKSEITKYTKVIHEAGIKVE